MIKVRLLQGNANRPSARARYKRAAILVVRLGQVRLGKLMSRYTNRPPAGARYKRAALLVVRLGPLDP